MNDETKSHEKKDPLPSVQEFSSEGMRLFAKKFSKTLQERIEVEQQEKYRKFCEERWPEVFSQIEKQKEGYR